jgi:methylated-DNA-protein-cysteine methyltransferase related protein
MKQPPQTVEISERVKHPMRRAIYEMVARIPFGRVATYGQIATLAGYPGRARQVGYALAGMPEELDLPWQRVINAQGKVSPRAHSKWHEFQYDLLLQEGIVFENNRIDLKTFLWVPEEEEEG